MAISLGIRYTIPMPTKKTAGSGLTQPMNLSADLAAVVGKGPMSRPQVAKQIWVYIKKLDLQDPKNKRNIVADEKLLKVFGGKKVVTMFEMTKLISNHLTKI